jgi:hypothetical protein
MHSTWTKTQQLGTTRCGCLDCGVHTLVRGGAVPLTCPCCGEGNLGGTLEADASRRARRDAQRGLRRV